ncbi:MAG: M14 family metallopeptidase [Bacteroidota bacterium]
MKKVNVVLFLLALLTIPALPQYHSQRQLTESLQQLSKQYSHIKIRSIARTLSGNDVWSVTIGTGETEKKKAILVVGGIEASSLVGSEHALRFIQSIVQSYDKTDSIKRLLDQTTIYVIPRANPDASESFFSKPLIERETNDSPYDDDRDGAVDEDGTEDLNKDGIISLMRIKDPHGEWIANPDDSRLMKKADPGKGEKGIYRLLTEGIDNDKDEEWNEDAKGGTDFNRNFTYNYQFFGKNSGVHQISEEETRALADFVFDHPNIALIFSFSSNDNLMTPWKNESSKGESPVISSVTKEDEDYFGLISKRFTEITKLKDAPKPMKGEGAFSEWGYFHAGRWSFAVRPWWPGETAKVKDSSAVKDSVKKNAEVKKDDKERSDDPSVKVLKWYDAAGIKNISVPWTKISHPDFPKQEVEIGGINPFVLNNPPAESLEGFSRPYSNFISFLAAQLPSVAVANPKIEKIGNSMFRISVDIVNNGYFPTNNGLGVKTRWVRNVRVVLDPGKGNTLSSGKTKQILEPIKGSSGYRSLSWTVIGKGSVTVSAESPTCGSSELKVELK